MQNKGESDHFLEALERILVEIPEIPPVQDLFCNEPLSFPEVCVAWAWSQCPVELMMLGCAALHERCDSFLVDFKKKPKTKCSKSRDLTAIAICDSNRESQITSDLKHFEPSQKSSLF